MSGLEHELSITAWRNGKARFTEREARFAQRCLPGLPAGQTRRLLDCGGWRVLADGVDLSRQTRPLTMRSHTDTGRVAIHVAGVRIGHGEAGICIDEMSVETCTPASATATACGSITVWQIEAAHLRHPMARHDDLARALQASFFRDLRNKLVMQNAVMRPQQGRIV